MSPSVLLPLGAGFEIAGGTVLALGQLMNTRDLVRSGTYAGMALVVGWRVADVIRTRLGLGLLLAGFVSQAVSLAWQSASNNTAPPPGWSYAAAVAVVVVAVGAVRAAAPRLIHRKLREVVNASSWGSKADPEWLTYIVDGAGLPRRENETDEDYVRRTVGWVGRPEAGS